MKRLVGIFILGLAAIALSFTTFAQDNSGLTTRVKDIARLQGVRSNQLTGMGLVVGLNGTGDSSKANAQIVVNTLAKWGITISASDLKVKNIAAVMITAELPPYLHQGDRLDIQVSSFGDAKSLQSGVLLQSPLTGADGKVYAVAQGPLYVGGYSAGDKNNSQQKNSTTVAIVPRGAMIEREVPMQMAIDGKLKWALNNPDFTTATRLAKTINDNIAPDSARAIDMGLVEVTLPADQQNNIIPFIAQIEALPITPDGLAKVIVNERTGTIIVGDKVRISSVAVTHRNITVTISSQTKVSQPGPLSNGQTATTQDKQVNVSEPPGQLIILPAGTDIGTVVRALNSVGTTPQDIIAILVAIKEAGALYGVLEFV